jgi:hypothetical protein
MIRRNPFILVKIDWRACQGVAGSIPPLLLLLVNVYAFPAPLGSGAGRDVLKFWRLGAGLEAVAEVGTLEPAAEVVSQDCLEIEPAGASGAIKSIT